MELLVARTVALLGLAMVVAIVARRLRLPYTVGLVLTGLALALVRVDVGLKLTHEVVFDLILPPLLFEAALNLRWSELRRDLPPMLLLATFGVVLCGAVVAAGLVYGLGWPLSPALAFGALISATDPIAVIALLRETGVKGRMALLIESESLLNDGVAAVLFALATLGGALPSAGVALGELAWIAGGGVALGALAAGLALTLAGRTQEHMVETAITAVAAYGSFLAAERMGASGVLATVTAGLLLGNLGVLAEPDRPFSLSTQGREFVLAFWEFSAFVANSFVFLLIGLALAHVGLKFDWRPVAIVALALIGRAVAVYPVAALFAFSRWRLPAAEQHFLVWGGLRGALALALALTLPVDAPYREQILVGAFAVVAFSVLIQGLTAGPALRRLGLAPKQGNIA
ncbi:MAG: cation:proton antiporter [Pseudomonadota bacterium]|nr:cation:proton antiporter [Pseudomonadota bacterium]